MKDTTLFEVCLLAFLVLVFSGTIGLTLRFGGRLACRKNKTRRTLPTEAEELNTALDEMGRAMDEAAAQMKATGTEMRGMVEAFRRFGVSIGERASFTEITGSNSGRYIRHEESGRMLNLPEMDHLYRTDGRSITSVAFEVRGGGGGGGAGGSGSAGRAGRIGTVEPSGDTKKTKKKRRPDAPPKPPKKGEKDWRRTIRIRKGS